MCVLKLVLVSVWFFFYFCSIMSFLFLWILSFFWWDLLFSVASVGGVSCVYLSVYYTRLWFCLFWACWVSGIFSGVPGHFFFLRGAPLCRVSGRYYLFECWPWVSGGAVQVFLLWVLLWWVRYGWNGGGVWSVFSLLSSVFCLLLWRAVVCGRLHFTYIFYLGLFLVYLSILCFISC